ncbi:MAG: ribosome small subunit-dependent GTPase A [Bacteroidales bacterium]|nr:ribosome small subunit-dependent GTPase A [Bacteroidales bacterium]
MAENKEKNQTNRAVVVKHTGSHYLLSHLPDWNPFMAVVKGKLRLDDTTNTNPIAVGDIVEYEGTPSSTSSENPCTIKRVLERRNCIVRRSTNLSRQNHLIAANIDRVFLTVTIKDPEVKLQFVDRFLVTCQAYDVPVTILLNKADVYRGDENSQELKDEDLAAMAAGFSQIYANAGYEVIETSVKSGLNIEKLRELCKDKVVLFSGQSGVGKSSLINALDPKLNLKTAEISQAHLQGKHTTTFYQMHPISSGGFVVDTPGIRGFGLVNFSKEELSNYFPEMMRVQDGCRFNPCTHTHEPGCAVKEAVERGEISPLRYDSYLAMLEDDGKYREAE